MLNNQTDSMRIERCPHESCRRPFQVNRFRAALSLLTEPGKITCPHCGGVIQAAPDSIFLAHALLPGEEVAFIAQITKPAAEDGDSMPLPG